MGLQGAGGLRQVDNEVVFTIETLPAKVASYMIPNLL